MKEIVCVDNNWAIGRANDLIYHIPDDMKYFRQKTTGNVVVMGLATLKSFPGSRPLKNRVNIVLCDDPDFRCEGASIVYSIDELLEAVSGYNTDSVYVIGGASVYAQMLPYCNTVYVTKVDSESPADKYFPNLDESEEWELTEESEEYDYNGLKYKFTVYNK